MIKDLEQDLREAVVRDGSRFSTRPRSIYDVGTAGWSGGALEHPNRGTISPYSFIPLPRTWLIGHWESSFAKRVPVSLS